MTKFEYKFELDLGAEEGGGADKTETELNKLGDEGWELVAVGRCGKSFSYLGYWFKRPVNSK